MFNLKKAGWSWPFLNCFVSFTPFKKEICIKINENTQNKKKPLKWNYSLLNHSLYNVAYTSYMEVLGRTDG